MGKITIDNLEKIYDKQTTIFDQFSLEIPNQSFTVILGPSGCGKSTLLRIISGLESITGGSLSIGSKDVTEVAPKDRGIAMVFQNYALYPHMTVFDNVVYSLKINKMAKNEREKRVNEALEIVDLTDHAKKRPSQLSGGQQQRVALARAIVKQPEAFLMDEPLSNLDAKLRNQMRDMLSSLHQKLETTMVFVTHDQAEAMSLADNIILLNKGKIMQQGSPKELYIDPDNLFVAKFIGSPPTNIWSLNDSFIGIKPEDIAFQPYGSEDEYIKIQGNITSADPQGSEIIFKAETEHGPMNIKKANNWTDQLGEQDLFLPKDKLLFFDNNEQRIRDENLIRKHLQSFVSKY